MASVRYTGGSVAVFVALYCAITLPGSAQTFGSGPCVIRPELLAGPHYQVSGRVIDDLTGAPIAGTTVVLASVCVLPADRGQRAHQSNETVTDEDGQFRFNDVPGIRVNIMANKDGYEPLWVFRRHADDAMVGTYSIGANTGPIALRLAPTASITGAVRDEQGKPITDAWVILECVRPWAGWRGIQGGNRVRTAADGSYRFASLNPGSYYLVAEPWLRGYDAPGRYLDGNAIGYVPQRYPAPISSEALPLLHLAEGQPAHVDFQLQRKILYHVKASIVGGSSGADIVEVVDSSGSKAYRTSAPGVSRQFEAWLPSGAYRLESQFTGGGGEFQASVPIVVAGADLSGVVFPLRTSTEMQVPIEIASVAPANSTCCCLPRAVACGFWYVQAIEMRPDGYFRAGTQSTQSGGMKQDAPVRLESIALRPGLYRMAVQTMGNVYAKSIFSGDVDLIHDPLVVTGETPDPIRIVLAEPPA
jgi:hypothetical protein